MRSGKLAREAGVNLQTLRYYERRGLLPDPDRSLGGHRDYADDTVALVRTIKAAQRLSFTLAEIRELIAIGSHRGPRPGLRERARDKVDEIDARIAELQTMRARSDRRDGGRVRRPAGVHLPTVLPGSVHRSQGIPRAVAVIDEPIA